jgi:hypothetical protein
MTQKFLNLFFLGKWHNCGHWSASLIICLVAYLFLPLCIAFFSGFILMGLVELYQYKYDSGWNWTDVFYNACGSFTFLLIAICSQILT